MSGTFAEDCVLIKFGLGSFRRNDRVTFSSPNLTFKFWQILSCRRGNYSFDVKLSPLKALAMTSSRMMDWKLLRNDGLFRTREPTDVCHGPGQFFNGGKYNNSKMSKFGAFRVTDIADFEIFVLWNENFPTTLFVRTYYTYSSSKINGRM